MAVSASARSQPAGVRPVPGPGALIRAWNSSPASLPASVSMSSRRDGHSVARTWARTVSCDSAHHGQVRWLPGADVPAGWDC